MTLPQFFSEICAATEFGGTLDEFTAFFGDIFTPIPEMGELHRGLHESGLPTYIFSNTNEIAVRHICRRFPFFADFSGYILSHQPQAMKPDARLYAAGGRESRLHHADFIYLNVHP